MNKIPWYNMNDDDIKNYLSGYEKDKNSFQGMKGPDGMAAKVIVRAKSRISQQKKKNGNKSWLEECLEKFGLFVNGEEQIEAFQKLLGAKRDELFNDPNFKDYSSAESKLHDYDKEKDGMEGLSWLFDYDYIMNNYTNEGKNYRSIIFKAANAVVCPYCDREFITYYENKDIGKYTGQLDHYYPKAIFPLFSLSLFNFIPSCATCNMIKGQKTDMTLYPYSEGADDDMRFSVSPNGDEDTEEYVQNLVDIWLGRKKSDIKIGININAPKDKEKENRMNNSKSVFKLEKLYQSHTNIATELMLKNRIYDEGSFLEMIRKTLKKLGLSDTNENELEAFLYGYQWENDGFVRDRPLSKFTEDIIKQIKKDCNNVIDDK